MCAGVLVFQHGSPDAKSCPEPLGGGGRIQSPGSEWRRSKFSGVVLPSVGAGATECDESKISSRLLRRCRMVESSSASSSSSSPTVKTAALQKRTKVPTLVLLSPAQTFSFSTHSLTHSVLSQPPFLCRGVVFRSPPATRGRPR